jgi:hypothetical protein
VTQGLQPALNQVAVIASQGAHVGYGAQGNQVESLAGYIGVEGPRHLVGYAYSDQSIQRVLRRQAVGVDHSKGGRQVIAKDVMVGNDYLGAEGVGAGHGGVGSYARITGEYQTRSVANETFQSRLVDAVALVARGDPKDNVGTQGAQSFDEQGGGGLTIGVKVTPNSDALAAMDGLAKAPDGNGQVGQVGGGGRGVAIWVEEGSGSARCPNAPAGQGLGDQWMSADGVDKVAG